MNVVILSMLAVQLCSAEPPKRVSGDESEAKTRTQVMDSLVVRVLNSTSQPVADAIVEPWALRSSQGHSTWDNGEYDRTEVSPENVATNTLGIANVAYPRFKDLSEGTRTISVSIYVDHPNYACSDAIHIDVPLENDSPYEVVLDDAVPIEIRPTIDGKPIDMSDLYAYWSDARSWRSGHLMERTESSLRIPPVKPGNHSVLVAKMKGECVTHFSRIVRFDVPHDGKFALDVPLRRVQPIEGMLSENVPRPIVNGRIVVHTVPPGGDSDVGVTWSTWVPIRADGTFTVDAWPTDEKIQLIALCTGFMASSGHAPPDYEGPDTDFYLRPQVFDPLESSSMTVEMVPLVPLAVEAIDEESRPVAGVAVEAWPNVGWWNLGSQIYCDSPLVKGERFLKYRSTESASDHSFPQPFRAVSDRNGIASLELPVGKRTMGIVSDVYELPVFLGRRYARTELVSGEPKRITMHLQAKGTEQLADWDKLAGVVFGCSTREGRRILALPGVSEKMQEFTERFREAKSYDDPELLARSYAVVASAFAEIEDFDEAARWYKRASEVMKNRNEDPKANQD